MIDRNPDRGREVLLGVGGGIAAYKSVAIASALHRSNYSVHAVLTRDAVQFVGPLSFAGVTGNRARSEWSEAGTGEGEDIFPHLYPATRAVACVVAPATANLIAKIAHGIGDDLLTTSVLSLPEACLRVFCPAMNVEMWQQRVVQENVRRLESLGWLRIGPDSGMLACGMEGFGRMTEPDAVVLRLRQLLETSNQLAGTHLLLLSGPTVEAIDPVRFISNHSSGRMGRAIALAAAGAGARVSFVSGPVAETALPLHPAIEVIRVTSADEMLRAAADRFQAADAAIFAAAVADYRPARSATEKHPKSDSLVLELIPNPDIAATLGKMKQPSQVCIGFALETHDGLVKARHKLEHKRLDAIVLNTPESLGSNSGSFILLEAEHVEPQVWGQVSKEECARRIIDVVATRLANVRLCPGSTGQ